MAMRYALSSESRDLLRGYTGACFSGKNEKCGIFLMKDLGKNSLKISMFTARTTPKKVSLLGVRGILLGKFLNKIMQFSAF